VSRAASSNWLQNDLTEQNLQRVKIFCTIAKSLELTPAQLALAWCLTRPQISSVITGATSVAQLEDNIQATEVELEEDIVEKLDELFADKSA